MLANLDIATLQHQQPSSSQKKKDRYRGKKKHTDSKREKPPRTPQDKAKETETET